MADHAARSRERAAHAAGQRWTAATLRERARRGERSGLRCVARCAPYLMDDAVAYVAGDRSRRPCTECDGTGRAPLMRGVELAAYCGDAAACELASPRVPRSASHKRRACESCNDMGCLVELDGPRPCECSDPDAAPFDDWLRGLARWGQDALVCAAVAAAREELPAWRRGQHYYDCVYPDRSEDGECPWCHYDVSPGPRRAIEAAEAWLACPCEKHVWGIVTRCQQTTSPDDWLWWLGQVFARVCARESPAEAASECAALVARALGPDGEARVRSAICRALIPVALGEPA